MVTLHDKTDSFRRGDGFSRCALVPASIADGYFVGWTTRCQIRDSNHRLIVEVPTYWDDPVTTRKLVLSEHDTAEWPVGTFYYNIRFTRTDDDWAITSSVMTLVIEPGVTL